MPKQGNLSMEELLSQCAEATEIAGSNMISWLDSTLQFKLVIKDENSERRQVVLGTVPEEIELKQCMQLLGQDFALNARSWRKLYCDRILVQMKGSPVSPEIGVVRLDSFFLVHALLIRAREILGNGAIMQGATDTVVVEENQTDSERVRKLKQMKEERRYNNECLCCLDNQIDSVCSSCSSGICSECAERWKETEGAETGCFVCRSTSERNDWALETWGESDLKAGVAEIEGKLREAIDAARNATVEGEGFRVVVNRDE